MEQKEYENYNEEYIEYESSDAKRCLQQEETEFRTLSRNFYNIKWGMPQNCLKTSFFRRSRIGQSAD